MFPEWRQLLQEPTAAFVLTTRMAGAHAIYEPLVQGQQHIGTWWQAWESYERVVKGKAGALELQELLQCTVQTLLTATPQVRLTYSRPATPVLLAPVTVLLCWHMTRHLETCWRAYV